MSFEKSGMHLDAQVEVSSLKAVEAIDNPDGARLTYAPKPKGWKQGKVHVKCRVAVVNKETGKEEEVWIDNYHGGTVQLSNLIAANILGAAQTSVCKDTAGTATRTVAANSATSAWQIVAGTAGTTAAVTDYQLNTQYTTVAGCGAQTPTVNAVNTSTDVFTVTANMQGPPATVVYKEVGIYVTAATYVFCIARDYNSGGWSVDVLHYLAVTYTITIS
jgi:hypothetical protein